MILVISALYFSVCPKYFVLTFLNFRSASYKNKLFLTLMTASTTIVDQADHLTYLDSYKVIWQTTTTGRTTPLPERQKTIIINRNFLKSVRTVGPNHPLPPSTLSCTFGRPPPPSRSVHTFWMAPTNIVWPKKFLVKKYLGKTYVTINFKSTIRATLGF